MRTIDLRDYVVERWGPWIRDDRAYTATMLRLDSNSDGLTLSGPLRVRVLVQARNLFLFPGTSRLGFQSKDLFCYVLEVPPGQTWSYPGPRRVLRPAWFEDAIAAGPVVARYADTVTATSVGSPGLGGSATATIGGQGGSGGQINSFTGTGPIVIPAGMTDGGITDTTPNPTDMQTGNLHPPVRTEVVQTAPPFLLGTNAGLSIVIRPAGVAGCEDPCAPDPCTCQDPCAPKGCGCNGSTGQDCGCGCGGGRKDGCGCRGIETLPCDFAVANRPSAGRFFPVGCEPCSPNAIVAAPPLQGPSLLVPPARGGTVRTRYFTGMFIGREDLETDQRNVRLKRALMNRAMGQGVVWGLGVGLDGDGICVMPGYGVDCCGNDLILSQTYRIEGGLLLRDPAAQAILAMPGPQRLHLVLEYFECPEAPRPVHGDPCANDARCEPSRMRETVRLRLAPPCDVDDSGPIRDFLEEVNQLRGDPTVMAVTAAPASVAALPQPSVPFTVTIEEDQSAAPSLQLNPEPLGEARGDYELLRLSGSQPPSSRNVRVTLTAKDQSSFKGPAPKITQVRTFNPPNPATSQILQEIGATSSSPSTFEWKVAVPMDVWVLSPLDQTPIPPKLSYEVGPWVMQDQNGTTYEGTTHLDLTPLIMRYWPYTPWGIQARQSPPGSTFVGSSTILHSAVLPTNVTVTGQQPPRFPCLGEPCGDGTEPLFPTAPPFLHDDPTHPRQPMDGKVIVLALLYAYVTGTLAKYRAGTPYQIQSAQLTVGTMLGRVASQLLFARATPVQQTQLVGALQRLLEAWCRGLLYPGPKCRCEPHGAVIGCVTVDGGVIQGVDPWGGRRWVVHYPLLAYWGQQFGIMPPDAIASKLFHLICCFAGVGATRPPTTPTVAGRVPSGLRAEAIPFGRTMLLTGSEPQVSDTLGSMGVQPARSLRLNPLDFIARVTRAIGATGAAPGAPLVRMSVMGVPDLTIVMPDDEAAAAPTAPPAAAPSAAGTHPLDDIVAGAVTGRAKAPVPSLLRGLATTVAARVADAVPLEPAAPVERPVLERLHAAGITTVGGVLSRDPEKLHSDVLDKESAAELASVLDRSERWTMAVAKEIADTLTAHAQEHGLASRAQFADPRIAADIAKRLGERLKKAKLAAPPDEVLAAVVSAAASA